MTIIVELESASLDGLNEEIRIMEKEYGLPLELISVQETPGRFLAFASFRFEFKPKSKVHMDDGVFCPVCNQRIFDGETIMWDEQKREIHSGCDKTNEAKHDEPS